MQICISVYLNRYIYINIYKYISVYKYIEYIYIHIYVSERDVVEFFFAVFRKSH